MSTPIIVLRHGELFLKGANRGQFERLLARNLRGALAHLPRIELDHGQGRSFVTCDEAMIAQTAERLRRVFGISSVSPALAVEPPAIDTLVAAALALLGRMPVRPASFRVTARRSDKRFPSTSIDIGRDVGAGIISATGLAVDLHQPELVVGVEIGDARSFVFIERLPGAGGLPVGCEGRVMLMLSGGIDSPVAGHLMQKRGCELHAVYFHSPPYTSERAKDKVLRLAERLAPAQGALPLHVVEFTDIQRDIRDNAPAEAAVVLYRRKMVRIACALARRHRCEALATGESLGQVASQTLQNLATIEQAADLPILRPLITYDKQETIALARTLGTYEISIEPHQDCCSLFVPKHPATRLRPERAQRAERKLDLALVDTAIETSASVEVR